MLIEHVKRHRWPLPTPTNDERLKAFRRKMAARAVVVPNLYFHNQLNKGKRYE